MAPLQLDLLAGPRTLTLAKGQTNGQDPWVPRFAPRNNIGLAGRLGHASICQAVDYLALGANPFVAHFAAHTSQVQFEGNTPANGSLMMRARISHNLNLFELIAGAQ